MKHLDQQDLGSLRTQLLAREAQLASEIEIAQRQLDEFDRESADLDEGQLDDEAALLLADRMRDQRELDLVRAALGRMDRGTYGRCLSCGVGIPYARLHAEPGAERCHVCQTRAEEA